MRVVRDTSWERRGMTLLWGAETLAGLTQPQHVVSIREFFAFTGNWPEALPSNTGDTLVVAGLEGCLDTLTPEDAADWLGGDLKTQILRFQDEYEGQAGLVLWLPSGRQRIRMEPASEAYFWRCAPPFSQRKTAVLANSCGPEQKPMSDTCSIRHTRIRTLTDRPGSVCTIPEFHNGR